MSGIVRRNTPQRRVVLEELKKVTSHPTASEIYDLARQHLPKISLGTVYRNLELLAKSGIIQKIDAGGGEARFDGNPGKHIHVRCVECGCVDDVHEETGLPASEDICVLAGYEIIGYQLEYLGICPQCRGRQDSTSGQGNSENDSQR